VLSYFDIGFDLSIEYYDGFLESDILVVANHEATNEEALADLFQEESREVIVRVETKTPIETLEGDDLLYVRCLQEIVKKLEELNTDERSAFYKSQYI
jgi:hypothetical protein